MRKKIDPRCCPIASLAGQSRCMGPGCGWFDAESATCAVIGSIGLSLETIRLLRKELNELRGAIVDDSNS